MDNASRAIDDKLDKISQELHSQRSLTKDDVRELVDYAAMQLSGVLDQRIAVMRQDGLDYAAAREKARAYMKTMPAWKDAAM